MREQISRSLVSLGETGHWSPGFHLGYRLPAYTLSLAFSSRS